MRTIAETPELRWFKPYPACRMCGKKSDGLLFGRRNESYGDHCKKCADKRLADSKRVREAEQQPNPAHSHDFELGSRCTVCGAHGVRLSATPKT